MVRLFEVDPDLSGSLSADEHEIASRIAVPTRILETGDLDLDALLSGARAFAAIVLEGMLLHRVLIGEQSALRLIGPGDLVGVAGSPPPALLVHGGYRATGQTQLALLDDRMLMAIQRFPQLVVDLQRRIADQQERVATQLVICQLPRVEDRVLAIMWLLAESWGRVTAAGTTLPLVLTHDAIGELIGAKRPTVTLALRELSDRGALVRQDRGWLLLEPLNNGTGPIPAGHDPELIGHDDSTWRDEMTRERKDQLSESLLETVQALRRTQARNAARYAACADLALRTRERSRELRAQISRRRSQKRAPS